MRSALPTATASLPHGRSFTARRRRHLPHRARGGRLIRALLCGADAMDLHSIIDAPSYGAFSLGLTDFDCLN